MPYIKSTNRDMVWSSGIADPESAGELNYCITMLVMEYLEKHWKGVSYAAINDIMGAMTSAQLEFYRRVAVPYEEKKLIENGDVF